jgi:protein-tyrosine phosphatase
MAWSSGDIFWIGSEPSTSLAIVLRPRGEDWLEDELQRMQRGGIRFLVSLLESDEATELGLSDEGSVAQQVGLTFLSYPIPDRHIPPNDMAFRAFVAGLAGRLRDGLAIGIHCRGSIGRATVTAACTLIELGWTPAEALDGIEAARGCSVPDTEEQRNWILRYAASA